MCPSEDWREDYEIDSHGVVESTIERDESFDTEAEDGLGSEVLSQTAVSGSDQINGDESSSDAETEGEHEDDQTDGETVASGDKKGKRSTSQPISVGQFFTGGVLSREEFTDRLPVIVYVVVLMLLYIANGFHIQQRHSRVDELNAELKRLNTVATTTAARRMSGTRQGEIEKLILQFNLPLSITTVPPRIIEQPAVIQDVEVQNNQ